MPQTKICCIPQCRNAQVRGRNGPFLSIRPNWRNAIRNMCSNLREEDLKHICILHFRSEDKIANGKKVREDALPLLEIEPHEMDFDIEQEIVIHEVLQSVEVEDVEYAEYSEGVHNKHYFL